MCSSHRRHIERTRLSSEIQPSPNVRRAPPAANVEKEASGLSDGRSLGQNEDKNGTETKKKVKALSGAYLRLPRRATIAMNMGPLRVAAAASFARVQPTGTVRSIVTLASRVGHLPCTCCCCCSSRSSPLPSKRIWSRTRRFATESSAGVRAAKVPHQALLSVEGRDAIKLLQGLVTNDVRRLEAGGDALYCAFLNPQVSLYTSLPITRERHRRSLS